MKSKQITFSDIEYGNRKRITKREEFLDIMGEIIPWDEWVEFVRPYYPSGKRGRPVNRENDVDELTADIANADIVMLALSFLTIIKRFDSVVVKNSCSSSKPDGTPKVRRTTL